MSEGKVLDIDGKRVSEILSQQYDVDYYQRAYKWGKQQMVDLLEDLYNTFLGEFNKRNPELKAPFETMGFPHYFLGTYVISNDSGKNYIVDGQQRLTSLTLLFMYLSNVEPRKEEFPLELDITGLISSRRNGGAEVFNIKIQDNEEDMKALRSKNFSRKTLISQRYNDIVEYFGDTFTEEPAKFYYFLYWMRDNVRLAQIRTYSSIEAYTIFETMNDRGMSLSQSDMLKGWILSHLDDSRRRKAVDIWESLISNLSEGYKSPTDDQPNIDKFFTDIIKAKYIDLSDMTRDHAGNSKIWGQADKYYRWLKNPENPLPLRNPDDFWELLLDLEYYSKWFSKLDILFLSDTKQTASLWHLAHDRSVNSLKPVILSALPSRSHDNNDSDIIKALDVVGRFLDTAQVRQFWLRGKVGMSSTHLMSYVKTFRGRSYESICYSAYRYFSESDIFDLPPNSAMVRDKRRTKSLLLRITDHVHELAGEGASLLRSSTKHDIEHILSVDDSNHDFFETVEDYEEWRNRLGALLVLPSSKNSSYGKMPYAEKIIKYHGDNKVAALLSPEMYDETGDLKKNNPGLRRLIYDRQFNFKSYPTFGKEEIRERSMLYADISKDIWSEDWFLTASGMSDAKNPSSSDLQEYVELLDEQEGRKSEIDYEETDVIDSRATKRERAQSVFKEVIVPGESFVPLYETYKGEDRHGVSLRADGRFYYGQKAYEAPGGALSALYRDKGYPPRPVNAWDALKVELKDGSTPSLNAIIESIEMRQEEEQSEEEDED